MDFYLKSLGYAPINYTSKIISIHKYFEMILEALQPPFEKYVLYIHLDKVKCEDLRKQIKSIVNCNLDGDNIKNIRKR